jgi:hypothetical protein
MTLKENTMADLHDEETINRLFPDDYTDGTYLVVEAEGNVFFVYRNDEGARTWGSKNPRDVWYTDDKYAKPLSHLLRMADRVWVLGSPTVVLPGANPHCEFTPAHVGDPEAS